MGMKDVFFLLIVNGRAPWLHILGIDGLYKAKTFRCDMLCLVCLTFAES